MKHGLFRPVVVLLGLFGPLPEAGLVYFLNHAPWLEELEAELFAFPYCRHDDQIDSISQALGYELSMYGWSDQAVENFGNAIQSIAMQRLWGRPW